MRLSVYRALSLSVMLCFFIQTVNGSEVMAMTSLPTTPFNVDMRFGDRGSDVSALQRMLGVVDTGYFGPLTRQAAASFQETYAAEVLFPAGLIRPTGFVGRLTRAKLNSLLATKARLDVNKATSTAVGAVTPEFLNKTPIIDKIVPDHGPYGSEFTIVGKNFSNANDIMTTYLPFQASSFAEGTKIKLVFVNSPFEKLQRLRNEGKIADMDIPFFITVANQNGTSTLPGKYTIEIRKQ